jgi:hypothetical protein
MTDTAAKCASCEAVLDEDNYYAYSEITEKEYCQECELSDLRSASTVTLFGPNHPADGDGPERILVGDWFIQDRWGEHYTDLKLQRTYHHSSAWRGYYETSVEGWTEIVNGWTTGSVDETVARKVDFNDWAESLYDGSLVSPCDLAVVTDPTSNVFSTAIGVHVPTDKVDEFTAWLNGSLETLRYALT